jgi:cytochrome c oxidase cbb3-type subunit 3
MNFAHNRNIAAGTLVLLFGAAVSAQRPGPPPSTNPVAGNEKAVSEGQVTFNGVCTGCHGRDGAAGDRAPALGDPARKYLRNSDDEIFEAIRKGMPGTEMPPTGLSETDAWKVTVYIRALRGTALDTPAKGNVANGEQVFRGKGECLKCHMLKGKGGLIGPDLSNIAGSRKLLSIRDALTKAEHRVATDGGRHDSAVEPLSNYQSVRVVTKDGKTVRGVLKNANSFSLQVLGLDDALHVFDRAKLREVIYESQSLMPTDYDKRLTAEEFQDLLAFLSRQGSAPARGGQ